jgi:hypothetical protein
MCENPAGHIAAVDQTRTELGENLDKTLTSIGNALKDGVDPSLVWMKVATDLVTVFEIPDDRLELGYMFAECLVRDAARNG